MDLIHLWDQFWGHFLPDVYALRTPEQWDAIRNWVTVIVGATAAIIALFTFVANGRTRRRAQARLVYAKIVRSSTAKPDASFFIGAAEVGKIEVGMMTPTSGSYEVRPGGDIGQFLAVDKPGSVTFIEVHNRSDELIGPVHIRIKRKEVSARSNTTAAVIPVLEPESKAKVYVGWAHQAKRPNNEPIIDFRDASGQWWRRDGALPIRKGRWFKDLGRRV